MSCSLFIFCLGFQGDASGNHSLCHVVVSSFGSLIRYFFLYFIISDFNCLSHLEELREILNSLLPAYGVSWGIPPESAGFLWCFIELPFLRSFMFTQLAKGDYLFKLKKKVISS